MQLKNYLLTFLFLSIVFHSQAQFSGTYSIDPKGSGSRNFSTFKQALDTLSKYGVSGQVTFEVADGSYNEQLNISSVLGASLQNNIVFKSKNGDSSKVKLYYASSSSSTKNYVIYLNYARYFTFKQISISRTGSGTYGAVVVLSGGSTNNFFLNNSISGVYLGKTTASYSERALVQCGNADSNNTFYNNLCRRADVGFNLHGDLTYKWYAANIVIDHNTIDSVAFYGLMLTIVKNFQIHDNIITNVLSSPAYGILIYNGLNIKGIYNNYISLKKGGSAISLNNYTNSAQNRTVIYNNMIMLSGSGHGFELLNCQYFDFIFNSVYTTDSTSIGLYSFNTNSDTSSFNLRLRNNVFYSAGGGTCLYFDISNTPLSVSDFNDLYSSRSNLIYYKSKSYPDLTSWLATGFDSNSVSIDHVFKSGADLHLRSSALNGKATPDYSIITDYDGQKRDSLFPDIGADEFNGTDASITKIVSPFASCKGQAPIQVRVKNSGSTKIDSLKISYAIDSSKLISAFIKTGGLLKNRDTSLTLGNANISDTVHTLKVYSSLPNNTADAFPDDDTVQTTFISAMAGSYTIGGNGADYKDFNSAVKDLIKKGVCSPVTFNVADSTYTETIVIPEIRGASATSTITFQSKSGDSSKVVLQYGSYGMPDYLVMLDGADYINFKQITFKRNQAFSYYILVLKNKATHDSFSNMVFTGDSTVSNSTTLIYSPTYGCDHISITHSVLMHAYEGIYFYAANNTRLTMGLDLRYNKFNDILFTAIDIHSVIGPTISGNFIKTNTAIA